jgi:hypothetical protein
MIRVASRERYSNSVFIASKTTLDIGTFQIRLPPYGETSPRQVPIGNRQPGASDVPDAELSQFDSPFDRALRREDAAVDRKLIICRGC